MFYIALMLAAGCLVALQSPVNAALSRTVGVLESSFVSFVVGAVVLGLSVLLWGQGHLTRLGAVPPWQWIGGALGAFMVLANIICVQRIGALPTIAAMILGNLMMAALVDHYGWFGLTVAPFSWRKLLGLALILGGMGLVLRR